MYTILEIHADMVTVAFDGGDNPRWSKPRLNLAEAPVHDKDALLEFCAEREQAYYEGRARGEAPVASQDVLDLVGTTHGPKPTTRRPRRGA